VDERDFAVAVPARVLATDSEFDLRPVRHGVIVTTALEHRASGRPGTLKQDASELTRRWDAACESRNRTVIERAQDARSDTRCAMRSRIARGPLREDPRRTTIR
jgi:hypothetical protein